MTRPALLVVALLMAGCARTEGQYPSLALRPTEKQGFEEPVRPPPVPIAADPALDARLAAQSASLDRIVAGFTTATDAARRAAGSDRPAVGSDRWLDAQSRLAAVDDWRAQATALAAEIDGAASARAAALLPPYPALEALRTKADAETERETQASATLQALLPG